MKSILSIAAMVVATAYLPTASATSECDKGDDRIGNVCVNTVWHAVPKEPRPFALVYRYEGSKKVTLWGRSQGDVVSATTDKLVVTEWTVNDKGVMGYWEVTYTWDGKTYSKRK